MADKNKERWDQGYRIALTCDLCGDLIYSAYSGEFVRCSCDSIAIDQTPYYCRIIGDNENVTSSEINILESTDE